MLITQLLFWVFYLIKMGKHYVHTLTCKLKGKRGKWL